MPVMIVPCGGAMWKWAIIKFNQAALVLACYKLILEDMPQIV